MSLEAIFSRPQITRACGTRKAGGVYLESGVQVIRNGKAVNVQDTGGIQFHSAILDPPAPYATDQKIGVDIIRDKNGVHHVLDWVGSEHYPYPSDFTEEGRKHGFSRKVSRTLEFHKLTHHSTLIFIHPRAIITNAADIIPHLNEHKLKGRCSHYARTGNEDHFHDDTISCTRLWYAVAESNNIRLTDEGYLLPERVIADTSYLVEPLPWGAPEPEYAPGIIAKVPLTNISVIATSNGSHVATFQKITQALKDAGSQLAVTEIDS